jgi:hypothetical protein
MTAHIPWRGVNRSSRGFCALEGDDVVQERWEGEVDGVVRSGSGKEVVGGNLSHLHRDEVNSHAARAWGREARSFLAVSCLAT